MTPRQEATAPTSRVWTFLAVVFLLILSVVITWLYNRSHGGLLNAVVFHGATGSFLYVLPASPPLMVPLAILLVATAVVSGRMWRRQLDNPAMAFSGSAANPPASLSYA
jgi:hypothetical protein